MSITVGPGRPYRRRGHTALPGACAVRGRPVQARWGFGHVRAVGDDSIEKDSGIFIGYVVLQGASLAWLGTNFILTFAVEFLRQLYDRRGWNLPGMSRAAGRYTSPLPPD